MKKLFILIIISLAVIPLFVLAEGEEEKDVPVSVYLFHLYYDNGQIFADRDFQFKYDILPEKFIPEILNTQFSYKGEVINLKGEVTQTFQFDPKRGDPQFLKGKISVKAPYFPDGQKVNFYDGQNRQLLSIFVNDSSFCNDDGVCNSEVGEDSKTCPNDCKTATPVPTSSTEPSTTGNGMIKILIYLIIGLGIVIGGWYGWKWWQKRKQPEVVQFPPNNFPPQQPLS